jgi:alkyl sulfatase BDS1-like metallo-beta-lactamase superfamily hydrolase
MKMITGLLAASFLVVTACSQQETAGSTLTSEADQVISLPVPGAASATTRQANAAISARLALDDTADFERARRGLLAQIPDGVIKSTTGDVVWDARKFAFLDQAAPDTANPSLWRQAQLNAIHGLFEVTPGLYQLRGYDLSTMTLIEGKTGWIVIDPLLTAETAKAALALANAHLGARPVSAVIFTHSHADHFGGVRGVLSDAQIKSQQIPIYAPAHLADEAISENILAGPAMSRRAAYMFGAILPPSATGLIDSGIGKTISNGTIGFANPTISITQDEEQLVIDGIKFEFLNTPGTEAPAEFVFYLPKFKTMFTSEIALSSLHNVLTLRGAKVRDPLVWSQYLDRILAQWGDRAEIGAASHNWPVWGQGNVQTWLANQRDIYRYIHDQTLRLANQGATLHEVGNLIEEPGFQGTDFTTRGYYGTLNHNSKATYQRYFGYFTGNPADLNTLPPEQEAVRMVELAGGKAQLLAAGKQAYQKGEYRWAASLLNHLVFADAEFPGAKDWLAACYEQMGFQAESAPWRNIYLTGAMELRNGIRSTGVNTANPDFVRAIPLENWFEALAARLNPDKAKDMNVSINMIMIDSGESIGVHVQNGVTSIRSDLFEDPTISVRMTKADLNAVTLGETGFGKLLATGKIKVEGNPLTFIKYLKAHDEAHPNFAIVTP